jgi:hypothetical protein
MDVGFVNNTSYSLPRSADNRAMAVNSPFTSNKEIPFMFAKESNLSDTVREQVMMNLKEVQNFLYMLIGSELRLHSEHSSIGSSVNTAA